MNRLTAVASTAVRAQKHFASVAQVSQNQTAKDVEPFANNAAWAVIQRNPNAVNASDFAEQVHTELTNHFTNGTARPMSDAQLQRLIAQRDTGLSGLNGWLSSAFKSIKNAVVKVSHAIAKPLLIAGAVAVGAHFLLPALMGGAAGATVAAATTAATTAAATLPTWVTVAAKVIPSVLNGLALRKQADAMQAQQAAQQAAQQTATAQVTNNAAAVAVDFVKLPVDQQNAYFNSLAPAQQQALVTALQALPQLTVAAPAILTSQTQPVVPPAVVAQFTALPPAQQQSYYTSLPANQQQALLTAIETSTVPGSVPASATVAPSTVKPAIPWPLLAAGAAFLFS